MAWFYLILAIGLEVGATTLLKLSDGFSKPFFGFVSLVLYGFCFYFLAIAFKYIPVGIAYAIWGALGMVCILGIGMLLGQKPDFPAILGICLIIIGTFIINMFSKMSVH